MGTATAVVLRPAAAEQFRGIFGDVRVIRFTVDVGTMVANALDTTTVAVPGLRPSVDVVLGWTHTHAGNHVHEYVETFHTWTDELHFVAHNVSGGQIDPPSVDYTVVIGRLIV